MLHFDFENSVGYWIFATTQDVARAMNEELAAHGITYRQWETLAWVSKDGEMSQSELAERMSIEAPTLVGVLDRMERDGWIQRVPAENDRRKKLIRPTERVEPLWAKMVECAHRVRARATRNLTPEQLTQLRETLNQIRGNLGAADTD
jgi:DNA-binding MarR family transcriptional regulator